MEPTGIKGWVCRFYDRNLYWLCRKRGLFMALAMGTGFLVAFLGITYHSLPEIGETDNARLEAWVEGILAGDSQLDSAVQEWICGFYGFSERQVRLLRPEGS